MLLEPRRKHQCFAKVLELALPAAHCVQTDDLAVGRYGALFPGPKEPLVGGLDQREMLPVRIDQNDRLLAAPRLGSGHLRATGRETVLPVVEAALGNRER